MPSFGPQSEKHLESCDPRLQRVLREAIKHRDFSILCGHRGQAAQDEAVKKGNSKKPWPTSKHNRIPSLAVDIAPYPIDWADSLAFATLGGYILRIGDELGITLRYGSDWNGNGKSKDEKFLDLPHIELVDP